MCCLKYEQEAYEDLLRTSPKAESFVDTPEGRGTVVEVDLLRQRVKVRMEDSPETISVFSNADIAVLRSGKAKKNDPPIPADLAPISGGGKKIRREQVEEEPALLEPIRFRYSTESVVDEPEEELAEELTEEAKEGKSRSRRRRKPKADHPKAEPAKDASRPDAPKKEKKEQPKKDAPKKEHTPKESPRMETAPQEAAEEGADNAKKPRRRGNYRRFRKPKPQNEG